MRCQVSPLPRPRRTGHRGYALIYSMFIIMVLSVLGASLMSTATTSTRIAQRRRISAQALSVATGAMDYALGQLKSTSFTGFSNRSFGGGTVSVIVAAVAGHPKQREVTAVATIAERSQSATRRVVCRVDQGAVPPVFYNALAAKTDFTLNGNISIGSTPTPNQGNVHCNEDVTLHGSAMTVQGKVSASGNVNVSGGPTITGGMESGVAPMIFPEVDQSLKDQALEDGVVIGNYSVNNASTLLAGKINGSLTIGNNGCRIDGVVWVTGSVECSGPVTGTGTIISDGGMDLDGRMTISATDVNKIMWITTNTDSNQAVVLKGNRSFKGLIYAPNGGVKVNGTPALIGGIMANAVTFGGNPSITRWTGFMDNPPPMPRYFQLKGWQEF